MLYFDTSFLAPLILEEATSAKVEAAMRRLPVNELTVSHWTRVEFASLLAREVRMGGLERQSATEAGGQFEAMVAETFQIIAPTADEFDLARRFLGRHQTRLRAGDALHLAIAANHGARSVYSLDKSLLEAGERLGLSMRTLG